MNPMLLKNSMLPNDMSMLGQVQPIDASMLEEQELVMPPLGDNYNEMISQRPQPMYEPPVNEMLQPQPMPQQPMTGMEKFQGVIDAFKPISEMIDDNNARSVLSATDYLKYRKEKEDSAQQRQNQLLDSMKLESDLKYRREQLDIQREENQIRREALLRSDSNASNGSSYMQDAKLLMQSDPSLDMNSAYALARSGLPRGVVMGADGRAQAIEGFGETVSGLAGQEKTATELAQTRANAFTEGQLALPKIISKANTFDSKNEFIKNKKDSLVNRASSFTTGFGGSLLSSIAGTPAYDLAQDTQTLLANSGFSELQEMRDNSPTGGALGSVAVQELGMLQAAQQNLLSSQSKEQYIRNLDDYMKIREGTSARLRAAAERDKKLFGGTYQDYEKNLNVGMGAFLDSMDKKADTTTGLDADKMKRLEELRAKKAAGEF
jgi:hypothetical protein